MLRSPAILDPEVHVPAALNHRQGSGAIRSTASPGRTPACPQRPPSGVTRLLALPRRQCSESPARSVPPSRQAAPPHLGHRSGPTCVLPAAPEDSAPGPGPRPPAPDPRPPTPTLGPSSASPPPSPGCPRAAERKASRGPPTILPALPSLSPAPAVCAGAPAQPRHPRPRPQPPGHPPREAATGQARPAGLQFPACTAPPGAAEMQALLRLRLPACTAPPWGGQNAHPRLLKGAVTPSRPRRLRGRSREHCGPPGPSPCPTPSSSSFPPRGRPRRLGRDADKRRPGPPLWKAGPRTRRGRNVRTPHLAAAPGLREGRDGGAGGSWRGFGLCGPLGWTVYTLPAPDPRVGSAEEPPLHEPLGVPALRAAPRFPSDLTRGPRSRSRPGVRRPRRVP
ncbi:hypothetical protein J1605_009338 [Eschrichtius robustus]|uniref:Basic proline-rich protein-like n=1 Tax=Eschrichtius robustus TaxID=9764 RepID=A0AB34GXQ6_ESCRO|nr:hypothetical protein J1605_009338 [Eschrichtius robustus]